MGIGGNAIERNELGLWCWGDLDVGEDIFAGSGNVGLNFDPIIPETHPDLGCIISLMSKSSCIQANLDSQRSYGWALYWIRAQKRSL